MNKLSGYELAQHLNERHDMGFSRRDCARAVTIADERLGGDVVAGLYWICSASLAVMVGGRLPTKAERVEARNQWNDDRAIDRAAEFRAKHGYDLDYTLKNSTLPTPRLQYRWQHQSETTALPNPFIGNKHSWVCHYELILPLDPHDERTSYYPPDADDSVERDHLVIPMDAGQPRVRAAMEGNVPCTATTTGERFADLPSIGSRQIAADSRLLGHLPMYVIAPDGMAFDVCC